ncbi:pyridoxamine-phosphate oxidase [Emiliania huxleyi CCMP1516]|uniref:NAD(P)H-hydrate epimerase n=2 Tax=Emiliania huxleyi TaxID=2903 RepID=A0A0D3IL25_EMIH1|nr:pyridoxamine-phosphate oxidase [Emiliania huxleyi CCMP1516]EOD11960.1 pyridoxamine-phosphate oxidase [Emiliania huxleyi CCMP1516]|eukprot:XP_005764389.1 pyridoxamine-phosphate oxidase [Emiliania huxleyi CCMP1516]
MSQIGVPAMFGSSSAALISGTPPVGRYTHSLGPTEAPAAAIEPSHVEEPPAAPVERADERPPAVGQKQAARRKRDRRHDEAAGGHGAEPQGKRAGAARAKKRKLAELAADLPQDLGATAEGRHAAFATTRSGGPRMSVEAARKAASHAQLQASKYLKVMVRCGHLKEAAAVMGGQARDPELRLLNPAAGLILSEDASAERQIMANVGEMLNRDGGGRGNRSEDAARFASAVAVAVTDAASPAKVGRQRAPASCSPGRSRPCTRAALLLGCTSLLCLLALLAHEKPAESAADVCANVPRVPAALLKHLSQQEAADVDAALMPTPGLSVESLMELSGLAVAHAVLAIYPPNAYPNVLAVLGPGGNGGLGYSVSAYYPKRNGGALYVGLAASLEQMGVRFVDALPPPSRTTVVVDAVFGFSFRPPLRAPFGEVLSSMSAFPHIVAVDVPSGWDVDAGPPKTGGGAELRPSVLVSLTAPKRCASAFDGTAHFLGKVLMPPEVGEAHGLLPQTAWGSSQVVRLV